ncbi:type III-B CRISPR module-associated protein Cmr5 [Myxococcus sp. K15C18031901]|uniref:type III-B CRISPR module-associated protein Cmr5 n=1 Tax=Myxococcus dinghuensis TaxID=2906761 RepID=UPI0020A6DEA0|nr:type III-B CRISPR module-associated protein Cmr5 [Myxococcus dinghuensis]MCP3103970.1 type III-B CRISPR module-associated protein Cmr5 [Myxococcus dinghuensis]
MKSEQRLTRDQSRAAFAYQCVDDVVSKGFQDDYRIRVNSLGSAVLRDGLAAALVFLHRDSSDEAAKTLLDQLSKSVELGLGTGGKVPLIPGVFALEPSEYMRVTREVLALAVWLRRAVSATFTTEKKKEGG